MVPAAAIALAGAALFASVVKADLDPIIIKVRGHELDTHPNDGTLITYERANTSSTRPMDRSSSFVVSRTNKTSTPMAHQAVVRPSQTLSQIQLAARETYRYCSNWEQMSSVSMLSIHH
jgi:hypothetical protein